jgi:dipeptidase E
VTATVRRLLLVSTSTTHGTGYLDHCEPQVRELFAGGGRILFVPWALFDRDGYAATARGRFAAMGLELESIHGAADPALAVEEADGIFIGGGNTFRLLRELHRHDLLGPIRRRVAAGVPYLGTSAGSNVASPTLQTTNDMPIVEPPSFEALGLVPFQINPHYLDPDPGSTHMGETRDRRLAEFLEENDLPVVALREGAMLRIDGTVLRLLGAPGGKLFRRRAEPVDLTADADLSHLLDARGG